MNKDNTYRLNNLETDHMPEESEETVRRIRQPIMQRVKEYQPGKINETSQKLQKDSKYFMPKTESRRSKVILLYDLCSPFFFLPLDL